MILTEYILYFRLDSRGIFPKLARVSHPANICRGAGDGRTIDALSTEARRTRGTESTFIAYGGRNSGSPNLRRHGEVYPSGRPNDQLDRRRDIRPSFNEALVER